MNPNIYISFKTYSISEEIKNQLGIGLEKLGFGIITHDLIQPLDSIKDYMISLTNGKYILLIIDEKYFESEYCMFELLEVSKKEYFKKNTIIIITDCGKKIQTGEGKINYYKFWDSKYKELNEALKYVEEEHKTEIVKELKLFNQIKAFLMEDASFIFKDLYLLNYKNEGSIEEILKDISRKWEIQEMPKVNQSDYLNIELEKLKPFVESNIKNIHVKNECYRDLNKIIDNIRSAENYLEKSEGKKEGDQQLIKEINEKLKVFEKIFRLVYLKKYEESFKENYLQISLKENTLASIGKNVENYFIGREEYLVNIVGKLLKNNSVDKKAPRGIVGITALQGIGGIGKTTIASMICSQIIESWNGSYGVIDSLQYFLDEPIFEDGILFIRFEKDKSLSFFANAVIQEQLGFNVGENFKNENEKLKSIANKIKYFNILIVLDSVEQNYKCFAAILAAFQPYFSILITSRETYSDIENWVRIKAFTESEAFALFEKYYIIQKTLNKGDLSSLFKTKLGFVPLAIRILACWAQDKSKTINEIIASSTSQWILYESENLNELEEKNKSVLLCFDLSFSGLNDNAKQVFYSCSIFEFPFSLERLKDIKLKEEISDEDFQNALDDLTKLGLIEKNLETLEYSLQPIIREYVKIKAKKAGYPEDEAKKLQIKSFQEFDNNQLPINEISEFFSLLSYCCSQGNEESSHDILTFQSKYNDFFNKKSLWESKIILNENALEAAKKVKDDKKIRDIIETKADTIGRQGKYHQAEKEFLGIIESSSEYYWFANYSLGAILSNTHKNQESIIHNNKNIRNNLIRDDFKNASAFVRTNGWILSDQGMSEALECFIVNLRYEKKGADSENSNFIRGILDIIRYSIKNYSLNYDIESTIKKVLSYSKDCDNESLIAGLSIMLYFQLKNNNYTDARLYLKQYAEEIQFNGSIGDRDKLLEYEGTMLLYENKTEDAMQKFNLISDETQKKIQLIKSFVNIPDNEGNLNQAGTLLEELFASNKLSIYQHLELLKLKVRYCILKNEDTNAILYYNVSKKETLQYNIVDTEVETLRELIQQYFNCSDAIFNTLIQSDENSNEWKKYLYQSEDYLKLIFGGTNYKY